MKCDREDKINDKSSDERRKNGVCIGTTSTWLAGEVGSEGVCARQHAVHLFLVSCCVGTAAPASGRAREGLELVLLLSVCVLGSAVPGHTRACLRRGRHEDTETHTCT